MASTPALMILSTGSESTYERLSSFTMELWISVHCPSLKLLDWADAVTTAKIDMAAAMKPMMTFRFISSMVFVQEQPHT